MHLFESNVATLSILMSGRPKWRSMQWSTMQTACQSANRVHGCLRMPHGIHRPRLRWRGSTSSDLFQPRTLPSIRDSGRRQFRHQLLLQRYFQRRFSVSGSQRRLRSLQLRQHRLWHEPRITNESMSLRSEHVGSWWVSMCGCFWASASDASD
jgi:hypothetical protein